MMVTTEMTAATPTTMPIKVSAVRSLLARRLAVATRNASQIFWPRKSTKQKPQPLSNLSCAFLRLPDSFVFLDLTVTNRDHAMGAFGNVVLVRDHDDRVAFRMKTLEEVHNLHTGVGIECAGWFVGQQDRRMIYEGTSDRDALTLTA